MINLTRRVTYNTPALTIAVVIRVFIVSGIAIPLLSVYDGAAIGDESAMILQDILMPALWWILLPSVLIIAGLLVKRVWAVWAAIVHDVALIGYGIAYCCIEHTLVSLSFFLLPFFLEAAFLVAAVAWKQHGNVESLNQ